MPRPRSPLHTLESPKRAIARRKPILEVPSGPPAPPPWLRADLVAEFERRAEDLARVKHTDTRDGDALALLVTAADDFARCEKTLEAEGRYLTGPRGGVAPHPASKDREAALARIAQAVKTLGVSPTTRGQVAKSEEPAPPDAKKQRLEALIARARGGTG